MTPPRIYSQRGASSIHQNDETQRTSERSSTDAADKETSHKDLAATLYKGGKFAHARLGFSKSGKFSKRQRQMPRRRPARLRSRASTGEAFDEENEEYVAESLEESRTPDQPIKMSELYNSPQDQSDPHSGKDTGSQPKEERRVPAARHTHLQLARPESRSTLAAQVKQMVHLPTDQCAAYAFHCLTAELLRVRDQFTNHPACTSLRPSVQELMLSLLCLRLSNCLFVPLDLASVRQTLIEAAVQGKNKKQNPSHQKQEQEQEQEEQEQEQEQEKSKKRQDKNQPIGSPEVRKLNLLMPLLLLNGARPSTMSQLKLAIGRTKVILRTALQPTDQKHID